MAQRHNTPAVVLLVGTQKGLFRLESAPDRRQWRMDGPLIPGYEVLHAWLDPRSPGIGYAATHHEVWGAHLYRTADAGRSWQPLESVPAYPSDRHGSRLKAIWHVAPGLPEEPRALYAGIDPAGLFVSQDGAETWTPVDSLNNHPTRTTWEPAKGGFSLHSIHHCPANPERLYAAVSAGGAYRSDDHGTSWRPINQGVRAEHLPGGQARSGHNVHRLLAHPLNPERLYRQCYNGVYRSDDGGERWTEITAGLPSDFGYALATEHADPDSVWVIPIDSNHLRTAPGGRLQVFRSGDGGRSWHGQSEGLPQQHAYVTVLREALGLDQLDPCGAYFGTSSGHLFASADSGASWRCIAEFLPRILSVSASAAEAP